MFSFSLSIIHRVRETRRKHVIRETKDELEWAFGSSGCGFENAVCSTTFDSR